MMILALQDGTESCLGPAKFQQYGLRCNKSYCGPRLRSGELLLRCRLSDRGVLLDTSENIGCHMQVSTFDYRRRFGTIKSLARYEINPLS